MKLTIDRETFKDIKQMTRSEITEWAAEIYARGIEEGKKAAAAPEALMTAFRETLKQVDDIGPIRAEAIVTKLSELFGSGAVRTVEVQSPDAERLIPKEVIVTGVGGFPPEAASEQRCPNCDKPLVTIAGMPKFCPNCGQALKSPKGERQA